jgi:chromosome segregation ATPase
MTIALVHDGLWWKSIDTKFTLLINMEGPLMSKMLTLLAMVCGFVLAGCNAEPAGIIDTDQEGVLFDRDAFKQRVEARLQEFELRLEELHHKAAEARVEVRTALRADIDELHRKQKAARERLAELRRDRAEKWDERRDHMEAALEDLRVGIERAFSRIPK